MSKIIRKSEPQLLEELRERVKRQPSQKVAAGDLGFTPQFLSDILSGRRAITERLAASLGYRRIVEYIKR